MRLQLDPLAICRYENKHILDPLAAAMLEARLASTPGCVNEPVCWITTFYFDRADAALCRRNLRGVGACSRLRLRSYGKAGEPLVLERKHHRGGRVHKSRLAVTPPELPALLEGRDPRGRRVGIGRLVRDPIPVCMVAYERRIYRHASGAFRLTIDRRLGAAAPAPDWLERLQHGALPLVPPAPDAPVVVESKHGGDAPRWIAEALAAHAAPDFSKLAWAWLRLQAGR